MTNEELFQDLKQFIDGKFSQEMAHVATKDDIDGLEQRIDGVEQRLTARINGLDAKLDKVQDDIAETLTKAVEAVDTTKKVEDHERRLTRLEHRTA